MKITLSGMNHKIRKKTLMKIVFVLPNMCGGGTERVVSLLANEYVSEGFEVGILLFAGNKVEYDLNDTVEVVSVGPPSGGKLSIRVKRLKKMRQYFKNNKGCYIYSFSTIGTGNIVLTTIGLNRKMLVSERSDPNAYDKKHYRNFFYSFAKIVICQTQESINSFPKYIRKKAIVIPNPLNPKIPSVYCQDRKKRIVTVGRLEEVKNQQMLIRAFIKIQESNQDYTLHIYGKGSLEKILKQLVQDLGISNYVFFHGFCDNILEEISDSSIFVLCSNYEGVSNSLIEAIALGIPVVATDCPIGGCREYVKNGVNGYLIPVGDIQALENSLLLLMNNEHLKNNMQEQAQLIREKSRVYKIANSLFNSINN